MSNAAHTVSKVGQDLVNYVLREVAKEFERGALSETDFYVRVLQLTYESLALAVGYMDVVAQLGGVDAETKTESFQRHLRIGQAMAIVRHEEEYPDSTRCESLSKELAVELAAIRMAQGKLREIKKAAADKKEMN